MNCEYCGRDDCDLTDMSKSKLILAANEEVVYLTMGGVLPEDLSGLPSIATDFALNELMEGL